MASFQEMVQGGGRRTPDYIERPKGMQLRHDTKKCICFLGLLGLCTADVEKPTWLLPLRSVRIAAAVVVGSVRILAERIFQRGDTLCRCRRTPWRTLTRLTT